MISGSLPAMSRLCSRFYSTCPGIRIEDELVAEEKVEVTVGMLSIESTPGEEIKVRAFWSTEACEQTMRGQIRQETLIALFVGMLNGEARWIEGGGKKADTESDALCMDGPPIASTNSGFLPLVKKFLSYREGFPNELSNPMVGSPAGVKGKGLQLG